jgi:hypothetical protein
MHWVVRATVVALGRWWCSLREVQLRRWQAAEVTSANGCRTISFGVDAVGEAAH